MDIRHTASWLNKKILYVILILTYGTTGMVKGQFNSPLNDIISLSVEKDMNHSDNVFFSSWRPYLQENIPDAGSSSLPWNQPSCEGQSWWHRKLFNESFLTRQDTGYFLFLDPVFDFCYGHESSTERNMYVNTRGVRAGARLGRHFVFETDFYENQSAVPVQVDRFTSQWGVIPGQGGAKRFKDNGWDFSNASGYISWTPTRSQNIQFGHGKHFVGDGYRSLLLSDNSFNYPYLKYTCTVGIIQYVRTIASFMNRIKKTDVYEFPKKTAGFNYLTIDIHKRLQVSLFESNIWRNPDSTGRFKPSWGIANPVILTNTLFTANDNDVHSLVGLNIKYMVYRDLMLYGQLVMDDIMNTFEQSGVQIGLKYFDVLGINGLFLQTEYNQVEEGTYSFNSNTPISYVHYNQAIAHSLGNNFREAVVSAVYNFRRFYFMYRFNYAKEKDSEAAIPVNFMMYTNGKKVVFNHIQAAWIINPRTMMQITAGYTYRNETSATDQLKTGTFFIAFRTALRNRYYDF